MTVTDLGILFPQQTPPKRCQSLKSMASSWTCQRSPRIGNSAPEPCHPPASSAWSCWLCSWGWFDIETALGSFGHSARPVRVWRINIFSFAVLLKKIFGNICIMGYCTTTMLLCQRFQVMVQHCSLCSSFSPSNPTHGVGHRHELLLGAAILLENHTHHLQVWGDKPWNGVSNCGCISSQDGMGRWPSWCGNYGFSDVEYHGGWLPNWLKAI